MPYIQVLQLWIFEHQGKTVEVIFNKRTIMHFWNVKSPANFFLKIIINQYCFMTKSPLTKSKNTTLEKWTEDK